MIPPPRWTLRRRVALELAVLALLAALYLGLLPARPLALDVAMALVGLGLVALSWRTTRERIWGRPTGPPGERLRRSARSMVLLTVPAALAFAAWGAVSARLAGVGWGIALEHLFRPSFFATLLLFIPWAGLQQTLLQLYLLGRLRALWPGASPVPLAALNGLAFGAVHLPAWDLALLAAIGGGVWSHVYLRDRALLPLVLSHAVLGAAYLSWVRGGDLVRDGLLEALR